MFLIAFFLGIACPTNSQDASRIQKRKQYFNSSFESLKSKPNRKIFNVWLRKYIVFSKDSLLKYNYELTEKYANGKQTLNNRQNTALLYEIGQTLTNLDRLEEAIKSYRKALELTDKIKDGWVFFRLNFEIAFVYRQMNAFEKSNEILNNLLDLPIIKKNEDEQIHCKYFMAENYAYLEEYEKALDLGKQLYDYSIRKTDFGNASYNLIQIGNISAFLEKDTSYFEYFHLANKTAAKSNAKNCIGKNFISTGNAYLKAGYPRKAILYFEKARKYMQHFPERDRVSLFTSLSSGFLTINNVEAAYKFAKQAIKISNEIDGFLWASKAFEVLGNCYHKMEEFELAKANYIKALESDKLSVGKKHPAELYKKLSDVSISLDDYEGALQYLDSSYAAYNSFVMNTNAKTLAKIRNQSDYYIQKAEITELSSKNKINEEKAKRFSAIIIGISVFLVIVVMLLFINRKQLFKLRDSYQSLVKKNLELDKVNKQLFEYEEERKSKTKLKVIKDEDILIKKLHHLLNENEVFTNPELSLKNLSEQLNTNTTYLSSIINNHYGTNFKSLINKLRVEKAKKIILSEEFKQYSMDGIANISGFKSRSNFYQAFKSTTGLTPTLFIKNYEMLKTVPENNIS